jgi:hypothetical protein
MTQALYAHMNNKTINFFKSEPFNKIALSLLPALAFPKCFLHPSFALTLAETDTPR